jgi:hypothetical protein
MHIIRGLLRSILVGLLVILAVWLITLQIYPRLADRLPFFIAVIATYFVASYLLLPQLVHLGAILFRNKKIPPYTHAADGLSADPVNIILIGTQNDLLHAFTSIGWSIADPLTMRTTLKMIVQFLRNKPYPTAPFNPLFLFGRKQDFGFQEPIGHSPRKRHHIRFWGAQPEKEGSIFDSVVKYVSDITYWTRKQKFGSTEPVMWVGACSKDIGFAFAKLTYQFDHRIDMHIDEERDYILDNLQKAGRISDIQKLSTMMPVGHRYISDGQIVTAKLQ